MGQFLDRNGNIYSVEVQGVMDTIHNDIVASLTDIGYVPVTKVGLKKWADQIRNAFIKMSVVNKMKIPEFEVERGSDVNTKIMLRFRDSAYTIEFLKEFWKRQNAAHNKKVVK